MQSKSIVKFIQGLFVPIVLGAFLYSFLSVCWPMPDPISPNSWTKLQQGLRGKLRNTDMVIVHPAWEDSAGRYFKKNFLILGKPNNKGYQRYSRIWIMLTHNTEEPSYLDGYQKKDSKTIEDITAQLWVRGGTPALYDFFASDSTLKVSMVDEKGTRTPCTKDPKRDRFVCPNADWHRVEDGTYRLAGQESGCLKMHPRKGYETEALFSRVPMGEEIHGWIGINDAAIEYKEGAPVDFTVSVGDTITQSFQAPNKRGKIPFSVKIPAGTPKYQPVRFSVSAKNDGKRHFCFVAAMRGEKR